MTQIRAWLGAIVVGGLVLGAAGCTSMRITMNPKVPSAELWGKRIPYKVGLLMDSAFQNYHWQGTSRAEMSKLDYDLGSASKGLFLESFMLVSKAVTLVDSKPPYSDPSRNDIVIVVEPTITEFSEKHSAWLRVADYYAEITYHVSVYDKTGQRVLEKDYPAKGVARGQATHSPGSNYAAPAERAMAQAIVDIIDDISNLRIGGE